MAASISLSNLTVVENPDVGTVIGTLSISGGANGEVFTYTLTDSLADRFEIKQVVVNGVSTYALVVKTSASNGSSLFDFETAELKSFTLKISATGDKGTSVGSSSFTIEVTDINERSGTERADPLDGTANADEIKGLGGNDRMSGKEGNDRLLGGAGNDKLFGDAGDDTLSGGAGKDFLTGGEGKDTFVFDAPVKRGHFDHVRDFNSADDTLVFSLAALSTLTMKKGKETITFDKIFQAGKLNGDSFKIGKPMDANDHVYYNQKNGFVYFDADGSGRGKGIAVLKLQPGTTLSADDFLFI